jgi:hypothetical protein
MVRSFGNSRLSFFSNSCSVSLLKNSEVVMVVVEPLVLGSLESRSDLLYLSCWLKVSSRNCYEIRETSARVSLGRLCWGSSKLPIVVSLHTDL